MRSAGEQTRARDQSHQWTERFPFVQCAVTLLNFPRLVNRISSLRVLGFSLQLFISFSLKVRYKKYSKKKVQYSIRFLMKSLLSMLTYDSIPWQARNRQCDCVLLHIICLTQITPLEDCLKGSNVLRKYNLLCICDVLTLYVQYLQTIAEGTLVEELKRQIHSTLVGISFSLKMCETE